MSERTPMGYVLCCDIDNTLVPISDLGPEVCQAGSDELDELTLAVTALKNNPYSLFYFGTATGRVYESHTLYEEEVPALGRAVQQMDFKITSVGTAVHFSTEQGFRQDHDWPQATHWNTASIQDLMRGRSELTLQPPENQNTHKLSYNVAGVPDTEHDAYVAELKTNLLRHDLMASVIFSGGEFLDFVPQGVHKGAALHHVNKKLSITPYLPRPVRLLTIAAGDSMNDRDLLEAADLAILPGNAHSSLKQWATTAIPEKLYIAEKNFAAGVLEGLYQHIQG